MHEGSSFAAPLITPGPQFRNSAPSERRGLSTASLPAAGALVQLLTFCGTALRRDQLLIVSSTGLNTYPGKFLNRFKRVGVRCRFIGPVPFHPREAQRQPALIARADLNLIEGNLGHQLRLHIN